MHQNDDSPRRALGMNRNIPRRDFISGALAGAGSALLWSPARLLAITESPFAVPPSQPAVGYPPMLTGLRGSQPGSEGVPHALRDGMMWSAPDRLSEEYDLVVVGAGISGLAAAHYYRKTIKHSARILLLENSDDFGGHARRNEFWIDKRMHLMNGGSQDLENPRPFAALTVSLLEALGIHPDRLPSRVEADRIYEDMGLHEGIYLDRETFGAEGIIIDRDDVMWAQRLAGVSLPAEVKADIIRLEEGSEDPWPTISVAAKKDRLSRISYRDFLLSVLRVDPRTPAFYNGRTKDYWATGIDAVPALDAWGIGMPGFQGLRLTPKATPRMGLTPAGYAENGGSSETGGARKVHLPDGNATVARGLLRNLIPMAVPGVSFADLVNVRVPYGKLDVPDAPVQLRLNSTAVKVVNRVAQREGVDVTYVRADKAFCVRARHCVLACYNAVIPYLCPDLPRIQSDALRSRVRVPLVYASVALQSWVPFARMGVFRVHAPGSAFPFLWLNEPTAIGTYTTPGSPEQPVLVHMTAMPCAPGLSEQDQHRAGRAELLATSFETYEYQIRQQLARIFGTGGLEPARDITAITVNRWPHGYALEHNSLYDEDLPESKRPHVIGRQRLGNIVIANSDAGAAGYMETAIEQAHRAVSELRTG